MRMTTSVRKFGGVLGALATVGAIAPAAAQQPKVIVISLDGAQPALVEAYLQSGELSSRTGLGLLKAKGATAARNVTATPSLTAVSHIAIATGSTAVHNDIPGNSYHAVVQPIGANTSGFGGPIGGYQIGPLAPSPAPTAEPMWVALRNAGKKVVTATWPGADGVDVTLFGTGAPGPVVQPAVPTRTVDYTVPFGAFGGIGAEGYAKTGADFVPDDGTFTSQLTAAGKVSYSPVRVSAPIGVMLGVTPAPTFYCATGVLASFPCGASNATRTLPFTLRTAAIDSTDDGATNYDTLVFFNNDAPMPQIAPGPFALPATGPAYARAGGPSAKFYLDATGNKVGLAFFVSFMAPDLSSVRFARYGMNFIPPNPAVLSTVEDVNANVGFWAPQPDFRIPERISPGFGPIPDLELEAMYGDQVTTFTAYQAQLGLRAIAQNRDADLVMIYFEQPDGSGHQFTLTDPRQPSDFLDNRTIGTPGNPVGAIGQDPVKVARYQKYLKFAYQNANAAVQAIIKAVGLDAKGRPRSNILVVSDHGMAPFHTAVNLRNVLLEGGMTVEELGMLRLQTSGPTTNIYVNLAGRESGGTVSDEMYLRLVRKVASILGAAADANSYYNPGAGRLFPQVYKRPVNCGRIGFCVNSHIGQDFGDVFAQLGEGYNFDGAQFVLVPRLGDSASLTLQYSVPNFYGAHGYDSSLPSMSAILYAAGPNIKTGVTMPVVNNIDIAPTVLRILGVKPAATVDGSVLGRMLLAD